MRVLFLRIPESGRVSGLELELLYTIQTLSFAECLELNLLIPKSFSDNEKLGVGEKVDPSSNEMMIFIY